MKLRSSQHYAGKAGEEYFAWQNSISGTVGGILNARTFTQHTDMAEHLTADSTVLDFGCGSGDLLRNIPCSRKIGIEVNASARSVAGQHGLEVYESLEQVADHCADVIVSNHALEHVLFPLQTLRELKDKLKPSGVLFIILPIDDWRSQRAYNPRDINHHLHTWTPQLLGNLLTEAGFTSDAFNVRIVTDAWPPMYQFLYKWLPGLAFHWCCWLTAVLLKRRQLLASVRENVATL